jgi:tetratricopeptide (TPR) repeat protein
MAEDTMFAEAVTAARSGEIVRARDLLSRLLRADSSNPDYWLWMSAVVDSERESVYCLRSITKLRPSHPLAKLGLTVLGQVSSGAERSGPYKQSRSTAFPHQAAGRINSMADWWKVTRNRENAAIMVLGTAAVVILLIIVLSRVSISNLTGPLAVANPEPTVEATLTPTEEASEIISEPSPTMQLKMNPSNQVPLKEFLGVNPTPTALYGLTPMPSTGAMDLAVAAFSKGDLKGALTNLEQVLYVEPKSVQAHYLKARVLCQDWKVKDALAEYKVTLGYDPTYAPAYLGRAQCSKQSNPDNDYLKDINRSLELDPEYVDAYVERADWYARRSQWDVVNQDLDRAKQIAPNNALVLIRLGRAQLQVGKADVALDNLTRAQIIDQTILEGYLGAGEAYNDLKLFALAIPPLVIYTTYDPQQISGWLELGDAYNGASNFQEAIGVCTQALDMDTNSVRGRYCRGVAYRKLGNKSGALSDLQVAADRAPNYYWTQFALGQAQLEGLKPNLAWVTLQKAIDLAKTPDEKSEAMGWQAMAFEALNSPSAKRVWQELMNLDGASEYWKATAYMHFFGIPTPTPGPDETKSGEAPPSPTTTPSPTPTPKR